MIKLTINGSEYFCEPGTNLGKLTANMIGTPLDCGGRGVCGKCRARVSGDVSSLTDTEKTVLGEEERRAGIRLLCQTFAEGDCAVWVKTPDKPGVVLTDGTDPEAFTPAPAFEKYGAAMDIGTTTLAARLYSPDGRLLSDGGALNPQRAFGADVMTRMERALAGAGEREALARSVRRALDILLSDTAQKAGIDPKDIDGAVITGNTVMLSFLTMTDTSPLTHAPFEGARLFGETLTAGELGLSALCPDTPSYLPACVSAFVGADAICALAASGMLSDDTALLADVGTNGEILLKSGERFFACSTAAGPAFEGAGISMGTAAVPGAIDRVTPLSGYALSCRVIGGTKPTGICGSGLVDALSALLVTGRMDSSGLLEEDPVTLCGGVTLSQRDVRQAQLAKSAIHAGIRTLIAKAGLEPDGIGRLYIAGGFGSYLDAKNAGLIGLLPLELVPRTKAIGNGAIGGASLMLLSLPEREKYTAIARTIKTVSLAGDPLFGRDYINRMNF